MPHRTRRRRPRRAQRAGPGPAAEGTRHQRPQLTAQNCSAWAIRPGPQGKRTRVPISGEPCPRR
eukprot:9046675-Lingulodinium_polyedra.AAC.1